MIHDTTTRDILIVSPGLKDTPIDTLPHKRQSRDICGDEAVLYPDFTKPDPTLCFFHYYLILLVSIPIYVTHISVYKF